ncbi:hypothetical protein [Chitinophaga filiformis]|uniref:DUF4843 domain-containing protein n=1 Tax=Chitinophaga filiformis TaxID=104663 RepID=A0ABY4I202_CHIFI|nr:hypothetical protein [Chitinophaga filiformis]UPK69880.1 hypothetical protein MYF79_01075 [Chitinophaga filiformis]
MRIALTILCAILIFASCKKDQQNEVARKFISFDLDSMIVVAENPSAVVSVANLTDTDPNNDVDKLTITATGASDEQITITLLGSTEGVTKGTFYSQDGNSISVYYPNANVSQIANQRFGSFTLSITSVKDSLIEGSFTGTLVDTSGILFDRNASFGFLRAVVTSN